MFSIELNGEVLRMVRQWTLDGMSCNSYCLINILLLINKQEIFECCNFFYISCETIEMQKFNVHNNLTRRSRE